jgi:PiT family inorganic phosphate transporter
MPVVTLVIVIIALALVFDFVNGFHDSANSIATVVSTRVLTPLQEVAWAAFFNFVSAFTFGTSVADTVGKGFVDTHIVTLYVILAGVLGAIAWDLLTWWVGLPTSSSHAIIGGYAGAAFARGIFEHGLAEGFHALILGKWPLTLAFIVVAPLIGLIAAFVMMVAVYWLFQKATPAHMNPWFRKLQLLSAAALSFSHGTNDAQKTMGIITEVLLTAKIIQEFKVPVWVILAAHAAIALGTFFGGWRIVQTMGKRLTKLKPRTGFCAETGAAAAMLLATHLGLPVSTTHAVAGSLVGVGSVQRVKAVRWGVATNILWARILTIPASAAVAGIVFAVIRLINPHAYYETHPRRFCDALI